MDRKERQQERDILLGAIEIVSAMSSLLHEKLYRTEPVQPLLAKHEERAEEMTEQLLALVKLKWVDVPTSWRSDYDNEGAS